MRVKDLSPETLWAVSQRYWWDEHEGDWEVVVPKDCDEDHQWLLEPMMNYYYPLPVRWHDQAQEVADELWRHQMPLVVVCFPQENYSYAFALTAAGMDLTWEICRAHILAGFLPPVYFCDLPAFGSISGWRRTVLAACRRSCRVARGRIASLERHLRSGRFGPCGREGRGDG
ncbi:MAG: hypothetical protein ACPLRW_05710 [Moorellales bacterium]